MQISKIAAGVAIAMAASVASADYLKFGFDENEIYTEDSTTNNFNPAMAFGVSPIADSPLKIEGWMNERYDDATTDENGSTTRTQLKVSYSITSGDYTFAPAVRLRRDGKNGGGHEKELHLFANNSFKLNDSSSVYLNLYANNYTYYKDTAGAKEKNFVYEVALGANYDLTSVNSLNVELFTEQAKNKTTDVKEQDWELRGSLSHKFDDALSGNVFGRYTFKDDSKENGATTKTQKDWRLGAGASYALNQDWSVSGNVFYTREMDNGSGALAQDSKKKYVYSLWITRSF